MESGEERWARGQCGQLGARAASLARAVSENVIPWPLKEGHGMTFSPTALKEGHGILFGRTHAEHRRFWSGVDVFFHDGVMERTGFYWAFPFSKSEAGCLQMGQMKSAGSSSPS